jgi:hypothetical protein
MVTMRGRPFLPLLIQGLSLRLKVSILMQLGWEGIQIILGDREVALDQHCRPMMHFLMIQEHQH